MLLRYPRMLILSACAITAVLLCLIITVFFAPREIQDDLFRVNFQEFEEDVLDSIRESERDRLEEQTTLLKDEIYYWLEEFELLNSEDLPEN